MFNVGTITEGNGLTGSHWVEALYGIDRFPVDWKGEPVATPQGRERERLMKLAYEENAQLRAQTSLIS
jgi:hypothetical protein